MAQERINIGVVPNDSLGDPLRVAFTKINNNFSQLYNNSPAAGPNGAIQFSVDDGNGNITLSASSSLRFESGNNTIVLNGALIPEVTDQMNIGSTTRSVGNIYLGQTALNIGNILVSESGNLLDFSVSVLPNKKADILVANLTGNTIAANTLSIINDVNYSNLSLQIATTPDDSAGQIIFQIPEPQLSYGQFNIKSVQANSQNDQSIMLNINKKPNGTDIRYVAYGTVFNGDPITTYDVELAYGNIRIKVNPIVNEVITHKISCSITN